VSTTDKTRSSAIAEGPRDATSDVLVKTMLNVAQMFVELQLISPVLRE